MDKDSTARDVIRRETASSSVILLGNSQDTMVFESSENELGHRVGATTYSVWSGYNQGSGSGMDADLLDGQQGTYYRNADNINAGTLSVARGGTGAATLPDNELMMGAGTSAMESSGIKIAVYNGTVNWNSAGNETTWEAAIFLGDVGAGPAAVPIGFFGGMAYGGYYAAFAYVDHPGIATDDQHHQFIMEMETNYVGGNYYCNVKFRVLSSGSPFYNLDQTTMIKAYVLYKEV